MSGPKFARLLHRLNEPSIFIGNKVVASKSGGWPRLDIVCEIINSAHESEVGKAVEAAYERAAEAVAGAGATDDGLKTLRRAVEAVRKLSQGAK